VLWLTPFYLCWGRKSCSSCTLLFKERQELLVDAGLLSPSPLCLCSLQVRFLT
jgi:hypothetical protein